MKCAFDADRAIDGPPLATGKRGASGEAKVNPGGTLMRNLGHFIGGREIAGQSGRFADVFQPMTGDVIAQVALATKAEVRAAVENAKAAQPAWAAPTSSFVAVLAGCDVAADRLKPQTVR